MSYHRVICISCSLLLFSQLLSGGQENQKRFSIENKPPDYFDKLSEEEKHNALYDLIEGFEQLLVNEKGEILSRSFVDQLNNTCKWLAETKNYNAKRLSNDLTYFPGLYKYGYSMRKQLQKKAEVLNQMLPPKNILPDSFNKLTTDRKKQILSNIAELSYYILLKGSEEQNSEKDTKLVEKIISARIWLEKTKDPIARVLALKLQHAVDSYILNNMQVNELRRYKIPTAAIMLNKGMSKDALQELIKKNGIDENDYIDFALSFDTQIGEFCRNNGYSAKDFLNLRFFNEAKDKLKIEYKEANYIVEGKKVVEVKKIDIRSFSTIIRLNYAELISTRKDAENLILPFSLQVIDDARNARFIAGLYFANNGFIEESEAVNYDIFNRKTFLQRVEKELSKSEEKRMTFPGDSVLWSSNKALKEHISCRIGEITDDGHPIGLTLGIFLELYNFTEDTSILFDSMKKENNPPDYPKMEVGKWLKAVE